MNVTGLFAGVGGLERGLAAVGHHTIALSEVWQPACAVLAARFDAPNLGDVTQLRDLPSETELLAGGFPCQDLSQAGRTAGISGVKSGLVESVFALLDRRPVPWVLLENVPFMLRLDGGAAMARLVQAFEDRGYRWAYRVVNSLAFVPQRRERVFFLASREGDPTKVLFADDLDPVRPETRLTTHANGFYWTEGLRGLGWAPDAVPPFKNGSTVGIPSPPAIMLPNGEVITPDIRDAERLQGMPKGWTEPAEAVGRASWRWSLVGNAVTAPVAEWIGGRLQMPGEAVCKLSELGNRWPAAACFDGTRRWQADAGQFPIWKPRPSLHEFLDYPGKPLSARATAGFLSRTSRSCLRFPDGFLETLALHLQKWDSDGAMRQAA